MVRELTEEELVQDNKAFDQARAIAASVIETPPKPSSQHPVTYNSALEAIWFVGQSATGITPWGPLWKLRDRELRRFAIEEPIFASALGIIASRNSGFSWTLNGPDRVVSAVQRILETANMGKGWHDLIVKTTIDLSTQDNGAFWEVVRGGDDEKAPLLGINHLDAARCQHTGHPAYPVIYTDMYSVPHLLPYYNVIEFAEMPVPHENLPGLQWSTLTRLLRKLQSTANIDTYDYEKSAGMSVGEIHLVKGITSQQIKDAVQDARARAMGSGATRYMDAVVAGTLDPTADVGHDTIQLKSKPADFDPEVWFKHYINLIAMAFESDYQEFAPLPGGGLGTGAQSEMLHLKSRGKGPGTFMKMITYALNQRILPRNIKFLFDEQDLEAEMADAEVRAVRAQTRAVRIASGEIYPEISRQMANDEGDLAIEYIDMMGEMDLTPDVTIDDASTPESQLRHTGPSVRGSLRRNADARQPARIPSVRPPTPLGNKRPPATETVKNIKEHERKIVRDKDGRIISITELSSDGAIEDQISALKSLIEEKSRVPTKVTKTIQRDEAGRIIGLEEVYE